MGRDSGVSIGSVFLNIVGILFFTFLVSLTHIAKAYDVALKPNWIGDFIKIYLILFYSYLFIFSGNRDVLRSSSLKKYSKI